MSQLFAFLEDEGGATSIEYAVMASIMALVLVATVGGLGSKVKASYVSVAGLF